MLRRNTSPGQSASNARMVTKLPSDFAIFLPSTCRKPLCIQKSAITGEWKAQRVCAISFSWCGNTRSMPPPWMSNVSPKCFQAIAEHSMCQPRRPSLARLRWLPQHEIPGIALVGRDLDARARDQLIERALGKLAVVRHGGHAEQRVLLGDVGATLGEETLDQRLHLLDMLGSARLDRG